MQLPPVSPCLYQSLNPSLATKPRGLLQDSEFESQSNFLNLTVVNFYILPQNNLIKNKKQHLLFKFSFLSFPLSFPTVEEEQ